MSVLNFGETPAEKWLRETRKHKDMLAQWRVGRVTCSACGASAVYVQPTAMIGPGECGSCHQFTIAVADALNKEG